MKDVKRRLVVIAALFIIAFTILLICAIVKAFFTTIPIREIQQSTEVERAEINRLHKKHGVSMSVNDAGYRYFIRDGKKCELK